MTFQTFSNVMTLISKQQARLNRYPTDPVMQAIAQFVVDGDDEGIVAEVEKALKADKKPVDVINNALIAGMNEVSRLWEEGVYFLPQVILSSDAMSIGIAICEKAMGKSMARKGKVVTHTAEGDIHDIGQVIVNALLNANGFEVIDLGADVPVDKVVATCKEHHTRYGYRNSAYDYDHDCISENRPSTQARRTEYTVRLRWWCGL